MTECNINEENGKNLIKAAEKGDITKVKYIVSELVDGVKFETKALISASKYGHLAVVKYLISIHIGAGSNDNRSIRWAARNGHLPVVKYLHKNGGNIHSNHNECFIESVKNNRLSVVKFLLKNGVDINCNDWVLRDTIIRKNISMAKFLIKNGYGNKYTLSYGTAAACGLGDMKFIKFMVEHASPLTFECLKFAVRYGRVEVLKYLVTEGIKPELEPEYDLLMDACLYDKVSIAKVLISYGVSVDKPGVNALHMACSSGSLEMVKLLTTHGANIDNTYEPFNTACRADSLPLVKYLLEKNSFTRDELYTGMEWSLLSKHGVVYKYLKSNYNL